MEYAENGVMMKFYLLIGLLQFAKNAETHKGGNMGAKGDIKKVRERC